MELTPDFKEFIRSLNDNEVKYLLVGGYAVAAYGYPRYTGDIDIWIEPSENNARKIMNALATFGFAGLDISVQDLSQKDYVIQLGYPPNRIDIITGLTGLNFDECWNEKARIILSQEPINIISLKHLRANKTQTNRDRDRDDLKNLPQ